MSPFVLSKLSFYILSLLLCRSINMTHHNSAVPLSGRFFPVLVNTGARRSASERVIYGSAQPPPRSDVTWRGSALGAQAQTSLSILHDNLVEEYGVLKNRAPNAIEESNVQSPK